MRLSDMIKICLQNLLRRKSRTILTVLGVVVGCCAIVTMLSIGIGVQNSQEIMLQGMGDLTLIEVYSGGTAKLDDAALKQFSNIAGVQVATGRMYLNNIGTRIYYGNNNRYEAGWLQIVSISADAMDKFGYELIDGQFPKNSFDVLAGQYTAYEFADTMRPQGSQYVDYWSMYQPDGTVTEPPDPHFNISGATLTLEFYSYDDPDRTFTQELRVTGVTKEDYGKGYETSRGLLLTTEDMQKITKKVFPTSTQETSYSTIYVKVRDISEVADIESQIKKLGYSTWSMESIRGPLEEEARQQQMMLGGLGAVSLFVAALGITNTMIMSISERTREIGVMKALGCYLGNIRATFLMEAGFIGLIGGIAGAVISYIISIIINLVTSRMLDNIEIEGIEQLFEIISQAMAPENSPVSIVPLWLAGFAVLFSIIIGLGSGFYPANKAVHISALEAIKRE